MCFWVAGEGGWLERVAKTLYHNICHDATGGRKFNRKFHLSIHRFLLFEKDELSPFAWLATLSHNEQHVVTWRSDATIRRCCELDVCTGDCEVAPDGALIRIEGMRAAAATHERHDLNIFDAGFERDIVSMIVL